VIIVSNRPSAAPGLVLGNPRPPLIFSGSRAIALHPANLVNGNAPAYASSTFALGGKTMSEMDPERKGKGTIFVKKEVCKGCSYCIDFCPTHALEFSHEFNAKGYHVPVLARPEDCTGCDTCGLYCPDFAIYGVRWKDVDEKRRQA